MSVAALVVSIVAVLVAGYFGWRQYELAAKVARIDEERRLQETTPDVTLGVETAKGARLVRLRNASATELDAVTVRLVELPKHYAVLRFLGAEARAHETLELGALAPGASHVLTVETTPPGLPSGGTLALVLTCRSGAAEWTLFRQEAVRGRPVAF